MKRPRQSDISGTSTELSAWVEGDLSFQFSKYLYRRLFLSSEPGGASENGCGTPAVLSGGDGLVNGHEV